MGKTSFCNLLFQHKFIKDYTSTEVMEASQAICVKADSVETNKITESISIEHYSMLKQQASKEIVWLKLDAENQLAHFKSLLESRLFHVQEIPIPNPEYSTLQNSELSSTESVTMHEATVEIEQIDKTSNFSTNKINIPEKTVDLEETEVKEKILSSDALPDALLIDKDESVKLITVIDTGGQLEYIHLLPAISSSPIINFIILDMTKNLDDKVLMQYKSDSIESKPYYLDYSNLDMIGLLMSLAVDSQEQRVENSCHLASSKPWIGLVGTHKDVLIEKEIADKTIAEINSKLSKIVDQIIDKRKLFCPENGFLFPVDNTTAGDSKKEDPVIKKLRKRIDDCMDDLRKSHQFINKNKLPIKWMILELEIKELHSRKFITYIDYKCIASDKAKMGAKEAEESLQHFNFLGVFLHFKEVDGLCDYVIINYQWLFKNLAKLLHLSTDKIGFRIVYHKEKFEEKRLLAKSEIENIKWGENEKLHSQYLLNLLVHLKVIASVSLDEEEYYYMPCIRSSTCHYHDKLIFLLSEPLLVQFSSGFLPRGFFNSLVVNLLENLSNEWHPQLHNTKHFSNVITFQLPDDSFLRLNDKIYYLEVQIRHYERDLETRYHAEVFPKLCEHLKCVCEKLGFDYANLKYGFLCHDGKFYDDEHIVFIDPFSDWQLKQRCCRKDPHLLTLQKSHKIWFKKVSNYASNYS